MVVKKFDVVMLTYLDVFSRHDCIKVVFHILSVHLFLCMYGCRDVGLNSVRMAVLVLSYLVLKVINI
jgi:hypothetical protein